MAFLARARHRFASQRGVALPVSVMSLMLVLGMSGLVMQQAVVTGDAANRDQRSKRALQAADAGMDVAVFRVSKVATATQPCPLASGFGAYENVAGELWCPEVQENLGDGKSYAYRVSAPASNGDRRVVASGTADGVTRRVAVTSVKAIQPLFSGYGVSSDSSIQLNSSAQIGQMTPTINTHARANGNIVLTSSANICGNATPGPGMTVNDTSSYGVCPGFSMAPAAAPITFPPVTDDVAKTDAGNDNERICVPALDPCAPTSDVLWNSSAKTLRMNSSATLTLRGSVYYFCSIQLNSSSRLILDPPDTTNPVLIYVGAPADCPGQPTEVLRMNSSTRVESAPGKTVTVQFLVKGSTSSASTVSWNSSSAATTPTAIYAPNSDIRMDSSSRIYGGIGGKSVLMTSSSQVFYDDRADRDPFDDAARKSATYRECRPQPPAGVPDAGC